MIRNSLIQLIDDTTKVQNEVTTSDVFDMYKTLIKKCDFQDNRERKSIKDWIQSLILKELPYIEFVRVNYPYVLQRNDNCITPPQMKHKESTLNDSETPAVDDEHNLSGVAGLIRKELQEHIANNTTEFHGTITLTKEEIPSKLFAFIKLVLAGNKETIGTREQQITRDVISISNQIMSSLKTDRQITYKAKDADRSCFKSTYKNQQPIAIGLAVRHHGRQQGIINLLKEFKMVISNKHCLYWETAIANAVLANMMKNNGYFLPPGVFKSMYLLDFI